MRETGKYAKAGLYTARRAPMKSPYTAPEGIPTTHAAAFFTIWPIRRLRFSRLTNYASAFRYQVIPCLYPRHGKLYQTKYHTT